MRPMRLCSPLFFCILACIGTATITLSVLWWLLSCFAEVVNPFTSLAMSYEKRVVRSRHLFPTTLHLFQCISNMTINMSHKHIYLHEWALRVFRCTHLTKFYSRTQRSNVLPANIFISFARALRMEGESHVVVVFCHASVSHLNRSPRTLAGLTLEWGRRSSNQFQKKHFLKD